MKMPIKRVENAWISKNIGIVKSIESHHARVENLKSGLVQVV